MRSLGTYRAETRFTTWLYRLVTNICLDGLRRRGRAVDSLDEPASGAAGEDTQTSGERLADTDRWSQPAEEVELRESAAEVREALVRLPPAQRLALTLHYFQDLRYEDIAETMGLPLNTVKSHIRRGKERLALVLSDPAEEQPCSA
jgi:RNA polymerase sigma-70 factor (ECF subfamily)